MEDILPFEEFLRNQINECVPAHFFWLKIMASENHFLNVESEILTFFQKKYNTVKEIKKLLKIYKFAYDKDDKNLKVDQSSLLFLLMFYGTEEIRLYFSSLPKLVQDYDLYIKGKKLEYEKLKYR